MEKTPTTIDEKVTIVLENNTYFYHFSEADQFNEGEVSLELQLLIKLKDVVKREGINKDNLTGFISSHKGGLKAILTLIGMSAEVFKRIITFIRIDNDKELVKITKRDEWVRKPFDKEWNERTIKKLFQENEYFREFLLGLFL